MAEKFDSEKLSNFLKEDSFNPIQAVGIVRQQIEILREITDLVTKQTSSKISKERIQICKDLINTFETTLFAYGDGGKVGELNNAQQREILVMIDDISRGKREYAHFQLTRNCDGIKELFSNKVFNFK